MLNSNFFQNRNSNPKNWLKLETCLLLYPSSMVKRVRISIFDFHSRFVDRRSEDRHTSKDRRIWCVHCARSDSDSCVAACQINWCIHNSTAHCEHLTATVTRAWCRKQMGGEGVRGGSAVGQPTLLIFVSYRRSFDVYSGRVCTPYASCLLAVSGPLWNRPTFLKAHVAAATVYMHVMQSSLFTHCRCIDGL